MTISAMASPLVAGPLPVNLRQVARDAKVPFPASMRDLLSRRPFDLTVRLQIVFVDPAATFTVPTPRTIPNPWRVQLLRMRQLYATAGIGVEVAGVQSWSEGDAFLLTDLDVGVGWTKPTDPKPCDGTLTAAQDELYAHRPGMAEHDVAVYLVRSIVPAFNGCATHPDGVPGAAVADGGSPWTLGHEVGHVLGLVHCDTPKACKPGRLMTSCGTGKLLGVPFLDQSEIDAMRGSPFLSGAP